MDIRVPEDSGMLPPLSQEGDGFPGVCGEALGNHEQCGETEGCP